MAQFSKRKRHAEHMAARAARLRENGRHDLVKPLEAYRIDHHRVDGAWRHRKNNSEWKGAKGKAKLIRGPKQPIN